jgi:hypothetical protein
MLIVFLRVEVSLMKRSSRATRFAFTCCAWLLIAKGNISAYDPDYRLDGRFLIEASRSKTGAKELQMWTVRLVRGLVENKQAFIDFSVVVMALQRLGVDEYLVKDVDFERFDPSSEFHEAHFLSGTFTFEMGVVQKRYFRIDFNKNGSLKDLTGSIVDKLSPADVTTFRLVREKRELKIREFNQFANDNYGYEQRK